ncbi:MAG: acetylglutamate kinase [Gammaproteobacteria bacterium]|nr:MAG: acetylglutamate kinase [Gammaproteobacteria bacterium]
MSRHPVQTADAGDWSTAQTLAGATHWLLAHRGATVVVKYGGNAMTDPALQASFAGDVLFLRLAGLRPVVVHGGGPQINGMLDALGISSEFVGGYRVTSPAAMDVVRMVLTGQVQRELVSLINRNGPFAVGMSGEDAHLFTATRRFAEVDGEQVDIGRVGDIVDVRPELVESLLADGFIPVVSSVARDEAGDAYNVNADAAAAALAVALGARKLIMLTDVPGMYRSWPDDPTVVPVITLAALRSLLPGLASGMIPKMRACVDALDGGVARAHVIDGTAPHSMLVEVFTDAGVGTMVVHADDPVADQGWRP